MPVYRVTVQKVDANGELGELVEIIETEREEWTSVFDFVDSYRAEMDAVEDEPEPSHDDTVKCCPECERPNQFGELCPSCDEEMSREREADDVSQAFQDEAEAIARLHPAWDGSPFSE